VAEAGLALPLRAANVVRRILGDMRVLVIEDDCELREMFAALLRADGATVAETGSGQQAIEFLRSRQFDAVLSDLSLPDLFGEILVRRLVAASGGRVPVIVISGQAEPCLHQARAAGARMVFSKPVEWDRIRTCLATA
jgi:two-component system response regulator PilR (NtrC family)